MNRVCPPRGWDGCTFIGADLRVCGLWVRSRSLAANHAGGGLHSTPGLASTVLTRRLAPAWGLAARSRGSPRRCTPGFYRSPLVGAISPAIYPFPTLVLDPARDWIYDKSPDR